MAPQSEGPEILYRHRGIAVVMKPSGLPSQPAQQDVPDNSVASAHEHYVARQAVAAGINRSASLALVSGPFALDQLQSAWYELWQGVKQPKFRRFIAHMRL